MPKRHITELACNVCGRVEQQDSEKPSQTVPPWLELKVADPTDARKKLEPVICPKCVIAISFALSQPDRPETPRDEGSAIR